MDDHKRYIMQLDTQIVTDSDCIAIIFNPIVDSSRNPYIVHCTYDYPYSRPGDIPRNTYKPR